MNLWVGVDNTKLYSTLDAVTLVSVKHLLILIIYVESESDQLMLV